MGWEGGADIYDPIGLNISCFCAHLHLLVSISARLSPRRGLRRHSRSVSPPLSPIIFLHMLSLPHPSLSLYAHSLSLRCVRSSRAGREREEDPFRSSFRGSSPSRDKGWLLQNVRGWKKLIERAERSRERERERGEESGKRSLANNFANGRRVIRRV